MNPLIIALDVDTEEEAMSLARLLAPAVGGFKVGLQLLMGPGPDVIESISRFGKPVFADAKLHDIPNTAHQAAKALGRRGARWVTVHALGGPEMVGAAVEGLNEGSEGKAGVLAVTILTSLGPASITELGISGTIDERVGSYASMAAQAGAEGVVCSAHECPIVKKVAPDIRVFTPGIRTQSQPSHDQARVVRPAVAIAAGADYLVVGRAVTDADDPVRAADAMLSEIRD